MVTKSTLRVLRWLNSLLLLKLIVCSLRVDLNGEMFGLSGRVSSVIAFIVTCLGLVFAIALIRNGDHGVLQIAMTAVYLFLMFTIVLESETFSPGNQGFRLRFNRAIWMASPIHWSVERLRDL